MRSVDEDLLESYEEIPYTSDPFPHTHPDTLATDAYLAGIDPPSVTRCRVLELGCSTGGNLLPMAFGLPDSHFIGIDLSPRQIEIARAHVAAVGVRNLDLRAMNLMQIDREFGEFDYIVCHGVFSWCPPVVQDKILQIFDENLAPNGIAYLSYNTFPGWHRWMLLREMMSYHIQGITSPRERVKQARALLEFVGRGLPPEAGIYGELIKESVARVRPLEDAYVYHEHLEPVNLPIYFHELVERAGAHRLKYLGESSHQTFVEDLEPSVRQGLTRLARDEIEREQYLDFLRNRNFRRTLLIHESVSIDRARGSSLERLRTLSLHATCKPVSDAPQVSSTTPEIFRGEHAQITTEIPLMKAILVCSFEIWPRTATLPELIAMVRERLRADPSEEEVIDCVRQCHAMNLVALHLWAPHFSVEPGEKPQASPIARLHASSSTPIPNLRHRTVDTLNPLDRALLALCDGTRDRAALVDALTEAWSKGAFTLERGGRLVGDAAVMRQLLAEALAPSLGRLAKHAFFV